MTESEQLIPPNPQAELQLPPLEESASAQARTWGGVVRVYPNALAFVDQLGTIRGYLSSFGILAAPIVLFMIFFSFSYHFWLAGLVLCCVFVLCLIFVQVDWVGFRYAPVLVNRGLGKVHVFVDKGLRWWQLGWKLWGRTECEVHSYDWVAIRGEVVQFTVFTGQIPRRESGLVFAVTDVPGGRNVLQRFGVGPTIGYGDLEAPIERWEHIRRFMQGVGPAWTSSDQLYKDFGVGFRESFWLFQPLFGPGSEEYRRKGPLMWLAGLGLLAFLPFTSYVGLVRYISYRMKREPVWPPEILASLGGPALSEERILRLAEMRAQ